MPSETTSSASRVVTAEELASLGSDFHGELVRGRLIERAPAGWNHGSIAGEAFAAVHAFVKQHKLGKVFAAETGFILERDPDTVRAPDVAFVRAERMPTGGSRRGFFDGAPDLAVEVISFNDRPGEVAEKAQAWLDAGVVEVWVIDPPKQTVTVHAREIAPRVLGAADTLTDSRALPGLSIAVAAFFE